MMGLVQGPGGNSVKIAVECGVALSTVGLKKVHVHSFLHHTLQTLSRSINLLRARQKAVSLVPIHVLVLAPWPMKQRW